MSHPNIHETGPIGEDGEDGSSAGELAFLDSVENSVVHGVTQTDLNNYLHGTGLVDISGLEFDGIEVYKAQGSRRALPIIHTLREVIPTYLAKVIALTGGKDGPIGKQFVSRPELEQVAARADRTDWLEEEEYVPIAEDGQRVEGLTHKYGRRVLATFTYDCAAYCRFCTRGRKVGGELHTMPWPEIERALDWIEQNSKKHPGDKEGINEIILSGGDPLAMPKEIFLKVMKRIGDMQRAGKLDIVRIGTRYFVHNPWGMKEHHYQGISMLERPNIMAHFNHPAEITGDVVKVLDKLRQQCNAVLRSQSVLLKDVNDDPEVLANLFVKLVMYQVFPYYVFTNDKNFWNDHFSVTIEKTKEVLEPLADQTGLANSFAIVIDVGGGRGKIKIPLSRFWNVDWSRFRDFDGRTFSTTTFEEIFAGAEPVTPEEIR